MTRPQSAIAATGVHKSFGDHLVLDGVDLDVADGTIFALLGPNGAGKTTMVQILSTLIGADAGEVRVAGHDLARDADAVRAAIGVTGQFSAVDNLLTGQENLILMADLHHLGRADGRRRAAERAALLTAALDIDLPSGRSDWAYGQVLEYIAKGDEELLDALHATLGLLRFSRTVFRGRPYQDVDRILAAARSAWRATEEGLVRRADPTAQAAFQRATATPGSASTELKEAWRNAYGRDGDPSDAWDHAIKAVEAVLLPTIAPRQDQAKTGQVVGELASNGDKWDVGLLFNQSATPRTPRTSPVEAFLGMLRLLYPNPDRHTGSDHRTPTPEEARVVVQLAIAVVQWALEGLISKR